MTFHFGEALSILRKTMPYLIMRMAIYGGLGLAMALYFGVVLIMGKIFGGAGAIIFLIGIGILYGLMRLAKRYLLYLVDAGHIAVITEIIHTGKLPEGVNQFQYGKETVTRMFKEISTLFIVDRLVDGILRAFNRTVARIADILPIPGMEGIAKIANSVIDFSLTYVDETILSHNLARKNENIWESARQGVILYAQNWKPLLITAAGCAAVSFVAFIVVFLALLIPFGFLSMLSSNETLKLFWLGTAFALAYGVKLALFKPFFQTSIILTFNQAIKDQKPNPEWEEKLELVSEKFKELKEKAANYMRGTQPPASGEGAPTGH